MTSRVARLRLLRIVIALAWLCCAGTLLAGTAEVISLPAAGKKVRNFARLEIESRWVTGNGYRPVRVTVINHPPGPTTGDRDFRVKLTPQGYYMAGFEVETEAIVEMPEGSLRGSAWIAIPQSHEWQNLKVEVSEGGERLDDLSSVENMNRNFIYSGNSAFPEAVPCVLFIDRDTPPSIQRPTSFRPAAALGTNTFTLPNVEKWHELAPNDQYNRVSFASSQTGQRPNDATILSSVTQMARVEILPPSELPDQWLHYTSLDLIFVHLDDALLTRSRNPAAWTAIVRWTMAGGTLIICGAEDKFERLGEIESLLGMPAEPPTPGAVANRGGWIAPRPEYAGNGRVNVIDSAVRNNLGYDPSLPGNGLQPAPGSARVQLKSTDPLPFAIRSFGTGRVVAMSKHEPLEVSPWLVAGELLEPVVDCLNQRIDFSPWLAATEVVEPVVDAVPKAMHFSPWLVTGRIIGPVPEAIAMGEYHRLNTAIRDGERDGVFRNTAGHPISIHPPPPRKHQATDDLAWVLNQIEPRAYMNFQRTGVSFRRHNNDFMSSLVPGTGLVPVWWFLLLISGFVIVIGPINYILLKQSRRLFMLLVTVPAGAAVITFSLFAYAVMSDGLGVRMRARSFTRLDQRTGQMACWARQSYYAGLAPSGGLSFPTDAAIYPIDEHPTSRGNPRHRELAWHDDSQQLRRGYISSRQTAQLLVLCAGNSERRLEFKPQKTGAPHVVNHLGATIENLIVRHHDGTYSVAADLEPDDETALEPKEYTKAIAPISTAFNNRQREFPEGYGDNQYGGGLWGFTNRVWDSPGNQAGLPPPSYGVSVLERELQRTATHSAGGAYEMPAGTYVALVSTSPEMPIGYRRVREQASLHIIEGRW